MKLIAIRDFACVPALAAAGVTPDPKDEGFQHANHIHKGMRFSIGTTEDYEALTAPQKELVQQLVGGPRCCIYDTDRNAAKIKTILDGIAKDRAAAKAASKTPTMEELIASAVATALVSAGVIKSKTA